MTPLRTSWFLVGAQARASSDPTATRQLHLLWPDPRRRAGVQLVVRIRDRLRNRAELTGGVGEDLRPIS
jgi:hypothetical protein